MPLESRCGSMTFRDQWVAAELVCSGAGELRLVATQIYHAAHTI
jgi:hypothetical protein